MKYLIFVLQFIVCTGTLANNAVEDWSPVFQKGIDSCIARQIPVYYIPAGRYVCKEPIILSSWNAGTARYAFFSIVIQGTSTFAGADGSGTILDFRTMTNGFGIGIQAGKGVELKGLKLIGAWNYTFPGAHIFYNTLFKDFKDDGGKCRDKPYSPYFAVVIDPFGPAVPSDGGYPGLSGFYRGGKSGSTGTVIEDCFFTNWVGGIITSPNGATQNAELLIADKIQFANMKVCVAGCQDQEKMNRVSNIMCWGTVHTCFITGVYGAGSVGNWYLDHWNIAGYTNQIVFNNQSGYYPSYFSDIYAESIGRVGTINSTNGTTFSNSSINFGGYDETDDYTEGMISGYGVTYIGCQFRIYGRFVPVTINSLEGVLHFRDCSFDAIPFYPQSYPYGYSDFSNCTIAGPMSSGNILNPLGPQTVRKGVPTFVYGMGSGIAARTVPIDALNHHFSKTGKNFSSLIRSDSSVKMGEVIVVSSDHFEYKIAGLVTAVAPGNFTVSYSPVGIDSTKSYAIYRWQEMKK